MEVQRCATAQEFLDRTITFRASDPVRTNVIGSVALSVATGRRTYDDYFWWIITDGPSIEGIAIRTAPHGMSLSPMSDDAATALGVAVAHEDPLLPSVAGPLDVVRRCLDAMDSAGVARPRRDGRREWLHVVDDLIAPTVLGSSRVADNEDAELVGAWIRAFHDDVNLPYVDVNATRSQLAAGSYHLWVVDDQPVSLAGHAVPVPSPGGSVARVGPVYTPPELRGHGYAAGVTAAVTRILMDEGHRVMLYTDAANPTSNGVYRRLGYVQCDEFGHVELE